MIQVLLAYNDVDLCPTENAIKYHIGLKIILIHRIEASLKIPGIPEKPSPSLIRFAYMIHDKLSKIKYANKLLIINVITITASKQRTIKMHKGMMYCIACESAVLPLGVEGMSVELL